MSQVKEKIFYDSDPEKAWFKTFEALMIKNRDHRRILNRQPHYIKHIKLKKDGRIVSRRGKNCKK